MLSLTQKIVKCPSCEVTVKVSKVSTAAFETCYNCHRVLVISGKLDTEVELIEDCNICFQLSKESVCVSIDS